MVNNGFKIFITKVNALGSVIAASILVPSAAHTAIIDAETGVLFLMFTGHKAKLPYEPGDWFEADCAPGALRYFEIVEG